MGTPWEDSEFFRTLLSVENEDRTERVVNGLHAIGEEICATTAQVAIAWVLRQPGVSAAIAGSANADRAHANARAAEAELSDDMLQAIDDLIPLGPAFA